MNQHMPALDGPSSRTPCGRLPALFEPQLRQDQTAMTTDEAVTRVLDCFSMAILLVGADRRIVNANAAARAMLKVRDTIQNIGGRLSLPNARATAALAGAIRRAGAEGPASGRRGIAIPARQCDASPALIYVLPLRSDCRSPDAVLGAVAMLAVASPRKAPQLPAALALLYDLTPAETRVLNLIVEGRTSPETARCLGVSTTTVRTHLGRVFGKTGASRKANLVRLALSFTLPL